MTSNPLHQPDRVADVQIWFAVLKFLEAFEFQLRVDVGVNQLFDLRRGASGLEISSTYTFVAREGDIGLCRLNLVQGAVPAHCSGQTGYPFRSSCTANLA
ncbi:MAG: hypothetical protein ACJ74Z_22895 [Bryobacteraceae bacterium]